MTVVDPGSKGPIFYFAILLVEDAPILRASSTEQGLISAGDLNFRF